MNKVIEVGRLTRDVSISYSQSSQPMCIARGTLAVDRRVARNKDNNGNAAEQQAADFIPLLAFSKTAEFFEKYGKKGTKFVVEGRIQTGSYTNREGNKVYTTDVVVEHVEFAESRQAEGGYMANPQNPPVGPAPDDGFMKIPDAIQEELPFN